MYHYSPHVFDLTQTFDNAIHWVIVAWFQEYGSGFEPLIDHVQIQTRAQEVLSKKIFTLRGPCKVVKEAIHRKTLLRSGGGFRWALAVCVGVGFRLQYLQRGQGICVDEPRHASLAVCSIKGGNTNAYIMPFRLNISIVDMLNGWLA